MDRDEPPEPGYAPSMTEAKSIDNLIAEQKEQSVSDEAKRLGSRPPLKTLAILSVGPLISQITSSMYGIVNTVWVSKAIGEKGMTAVSTYLVFDSIGRAFGFFL